jgi:hypothetical protein
VPLKLIAVPKDPIAGDKAAGEALLAGASSTTAPKCRRRLRFRDRRAARGFHDYLQASPGCATFRRGHRASAAPSSPRR